MNRLTANWITEGLMDLEYKKYVLLAYLKMVQQNFGDAKLYPDLSDLVMHYNNLKTIQENRDLLISSDPSRTCKLDLENLQLNYEGMLKDDDLMKEIASVIEYAIPKVQQTLDEGKEIYEFVEGNMNLEVVGVMPVYDQEGYLLLASDKDPSVEIYNYKVSIFQRSDEQFRSIRTSLLSKELRSITNTFERIKLQLIEQHRSLPNPATFLALSKLSFPTHETMLPIAKRLLMRNVKQVA